MSKLIIVPTPIGNLKDITYRAIEVLKNADMILAEDTRFTSILLKHYDINTHMISYHKFNEHQVTNKIIQQIKKGLIVALVSDAGTPGISDPGYMIVKACILNDIEVECLPGPTAFIPALVNSGLPCDRFVFEGFLPQKKGRLKRLKELSFENRTLVFYESPHRLLKMLGQVLDIFKEERKICIARELTKIHEEIFRGNISEAIAHFNKKTVKGEIVVILDGYEKKNQE